MAYISVLFIYINYLLFPACMQGIVCLIPLSATCIAKNTAVVVTEMSLSVSLFDLINFNFSAHRGHRRAYKCVLARPLLDRLCVYLPNCVLYVSDVHAQTGAWSVQCPSPLTCMNSHGSMAHANVNKV